MRGFRNILVHEYGAVDDAIVFRAATAEVEDLERVRDELLASLRRLKTS
ncbi:MAG: HepT-like ribonuclease domain-containing protein [Candidatus Binatia bacterium]